MASQKTIYCIHANDAAQHLGKFQQISDRFKTENRIEDFIALSADQANQMLPEKAGGKDLVVVMLTNGLDSRLEELRDLLKQQQRNSANIRLAEIIVDNIPYENDFITLPHNDGKPIRERADMDQVWSNIEKDLEALFPKSSFQWKKVLIPVAGILESITSIISNHQFTGLTFSCGDHDHTIRSPRAINRRRTRIFQHVH